ncbi:MAG TPA: hypothetical protein VLL97_12765 [Acidobacteriota bacterium]|nr:hypothetical protein [Acidobacteriota bacterium]
MDRTRLPSTLALLFILATAGCARIADPQPPSHLIPLPADDLSLRQVADSVLLTASLPVRNTDGSPAATLRYVEVFRLTEKTDGGGNAFFTEEQFLDSAAHIMTIDGAAVSTGRNDNKLVIKDTPPPPSETAALYSHTYAVVFVNNRRQAAGISNLATITPVVIPPAPRELAARVEEKAIRLTWEPPDENIGGAKSIRIEGYNVYRSEDPDSDTPVLLNPRPIRQARFDDRDFKFGRTYSYTVSTVVTIGPPPAESLPSAAVSVTAIDIFPPSPPADFSALRQVNAVFLLWTPSPSQDTAGYRIYRKKTNETARKLIDEVAATSLSYRDEMSDENHRYEYFISAVDADGNESKALGAMVDVH